MQTKGILALVTSLCETSKQRFKVPDLLRGVKRAARFMIHELIVLRPSARYCLVDSEAPRIAFMFYTFYECNISQAAERYLVIAQRT